MKKIIIGMLALAAFGFSASAQETPKATSLKHGQHKRMQKHAIAKQLNLSDDQKMQIKANREATKQQMLALNKNENITVKEFRIKKAAIHKKQKEKMSSLLSVDQKKQLEKNKAVRKQEALAKHAQHLDKMKARLNLSDEQVSKLKAQQSNNEERREAIVKNTQLNKGERKEKMMALKAEKKAAFNNVLTPEQLSKMEEMKKNRRQQVK